jgi:hypothetical protein
MAMSLGCAGNRLYAGLREDEPRCQVLKLAAEYDSHHRRTKQPGEEDDLLDEAEIDEDACH